MTTTTQDDNQTITVEQAQELITNRQATIMQEADEFVNKLIQSQEDETKTLITQDDQNQADDLLTNL